MIRHTSPIQVDMVDSRTRGRRIVARQSASCFPQAVDPTAFSVRVRGGAGDRDTTFRVPKAILLQWGRQIGADGIAMYLQFASHRFRGNNTCLVSVGALQAALHLSEKRVRAVLSRLHELRLIDAMPLEDGASWEVSLLQPGSEEALRFEAGRWFWLDAQVLKMVAQSQSIGRMAASCVAVYAVLAAFAEVQARGGRAARPGERIYLKQETIARIVGRSRKTVNEAVGRLEDEGLVVAIEQGGGWRRNDCYVLVVPGSMPRSARPRTFCRPQRRPNGSWADLKTGEVHGPGDEGVVTDSTRSKGYSNSMGFHGDFRCTGNLGHEDRRSGPEGVFPTDQQVKLGHPVAGPGALPRPFGSRGDTAPST